MHFISPIDRLTEVEGAECPLAGRGGGGVGGGGDGGGGERGAGLLVRPSQLHAGHWRLGDAGGGAVERTYEITNVAVNGMTKSHKGVGGSGGWWGVFWFALSAPL